MARITFRATVIASPTRPQVTSVLDGHEGASRTEESEVSYGMHRIAHRASSLLRFVQAWAPWLLTAAATHEFHFEDSP
jgi:hypothetical protein